MSFKDFVRESNRIEGIRREPTDNEVSAHKMLLAGAEITVFDLEAFVKVIQPGAVLRRHLGLNVRVGDHIAPEGGPKIVDDLHDILRETNGDDPYALHHEYETLHPFTDGNGRSGRAIWLWMMQNTGELGRALELGFLHNWYYQSLSGCRMVTPKGSIK